jgi:hypothetical protein
LTEDSLPNEIPFSFSVSLNSSSSISSTGYWESSPQSGWPVGPTLDCAGAFAEGLEAGGGNGVCESVGDCFTFDCAGAFSEGLQAGGGFEF